MNIYLNIVIKGDICQKKTTLRVKCLKTKVNGIQTNAGIATTCFWEHSEREKSKHVTCEPSFNKKGVGRRKLMEYGVMKHLERRGHE